MIRPKSFVRGGHVFALQLLKVLDVLKVVVAALDLEVYRLPVAAAF